MTLREHAHDSGRSRAWLRVPYPPFPVLLHYERDLRGDGL